eukprot:4423870-Amphidinium_carterae.1
MLESKREHVEVEVRFNWDDSTRELLLQRALGTPVDRTFEDRYYDDGGRSLTLNDYWLRMREGQWEMKYADREGGAKHGAYCEVCQESLIQSILNEHLQLNVPQGVPLAMSLQEAGIGSFATLRTQRLSFDVRADRA